jgi:hypothetical protein
MKNTLLLSVLLITIFSNTLIGQANIKDTLKIYQAIAGKYELYSDRQYYFNIQLYVENGSLLFKGENERNSTITIPVDLDSLKFKSSDSDGEQYLNFQRNTEGKIITCRLAEDGSESFGHKSDNNADTAQIANKLYTAETLREDLTQIKTILVKNHPAVYQFTSKDAFEKNFNEQIAKINRPMKLREYFLIAAPIVESVHCGHTWISTPDKFWDNESLIFLPIQVKLIKDKAYVIRCYDRENTIPLGSEIIAINKIPISEVIRTTKKLISGDGKIETGKYAILNYFSFPDLFVLNYGTYSPYKVDYLIPVYKEVKTQMLNPVKKSSLWEKSGTDAKITSTGDPNLDLEINHNEKLAVVTIKSFNYYMEKEKFYSFIDSAFEQISKANIPNLILDLRDNMGGDPYSSAYLFSYLELKPLPYFAKAYEWGYEHFADPTPVAKKNAFKGNLFVLINGGCFSSTGHLCSLLKYHKRGTFIGEETGGTYECNDGSSTYNTKETRLNLHVARVTFTTATQGLSREHGIMPDYNVEPQIEDIIRGSDMVKEYAIRLIDKSK